MRIGRLYAGCSATLCQAWVEDDTYCNRDFTHTSGPPRPHAIPTFTVDRHPQDDQSTS
ncbi:hypothetical protein [Pelagibius sp. Alg239-R121]|uniref:hypothetical protein n=1 Tax=Pelagibius sp. Alg239-R121 TaxID=2993448 RepID=UPI0024A7896E|nr:hypothetical protein [Pelagibius sp. Alg239-R121]